MYLSSHSVTLEDRAQRKRKACDEEVGLGRAGGVLLCLLILHGLAASHSSSCEGGALLNSASPDSASLSLGLAT